MAQYVDGVLVSEKTVGLQVDVFYGKAAVGVEQILEVKESASLGTQVMGMHFPTTVPESYECVGAYRPESKIPVSFSAENLGKPTVTVEVAEGMQDTDTAKFDALAFLDEKEKLDALTEAEKVELSNITYLELKAITVKSHDHKPPTTAKEDAAIAIIQHEGLPKVGQAHNTKPGVGPVTGAVVTLTVGGHKFTEKSPGLIAAIKDCKGDRTLYQYSWTGVAVSVLDEPK
jgi:hypothetical protein